MKTTDWRRNFSCIANAILHCFSATIERRIKLSARFSKTEKFLRSCRDRWLLPARAWTDGANESTGRREERKGWWKAGVLLKVAARKKKPFALRRTSIRLHVQPRYEASLRAISNGLHWASANVKFDVHDYCDPPGRPARDPAGRGGVSAEDSAEWDDARR